MTFMWVYCVVQYPSKPGSQSMALCDVVCTLSIANSTFTNLSIVNLMILFDFILKCVLFW